MRTIRRKWAWGVLSLLCCVASSNAIVLQDLNSSVLISPNTPFGMYSWQVDGVPQLYQQWFWYRVGSEGPEHSIDTLVLCRDRSCIIGNTMAQLVYSDPQGQFDIQVTYLLTGGSPGSGQSDIAETIRILNTGDTALDFHFFQYSDFDLGGDSADDTAELVNPNTVAQWDNAQVLSETVVTPPPNRWEIGQAPGTSLSLNDPNPTLLNGNSFYGPGDATWAFQWDPVIAVGGSFLISKDKQVRPVPEASSTFAMLGSVLAVLAMAHRRMIR